MRHGFVRRMKRRLLNLLTVLSLLLAVAVAVVWAWSYDTWRLGVARGRILLLVTEGPDGEAYVQRFLRHDSPAAQPWEDLRTRAAHSTALAGFEHHRGQFADYTSVFEFSLRRATLAARSPGAGAAGGADLARPARAPPRPARPVPRVRLRPPRQPRPVSRMRPRPRRRGGSVKWDA